MVRKTKEEANITKELIFDAASEVFLSKGVASSSLKDIAKQAGVTRGAIYWHFKNKLELFKELYIQTHNNLKLLLKAVTSDKTPNNLVKFRIVLADLLRDVMINDKIKKILTIFLLRSDYSGEMEEIRELYNKSSKDIIKIFENFFKKLQMENKIRKDVNIKLMALFFHCYIRGIVIEHLSCPNRINLAKDSKKFIDIFFQGFII